MKREFDIKQLRRKWENHHKNSLDERKEVQEQLTNSPSLTIKYFAKLNFYNVLFDRANDLTTLDDLTFILKDMSANPIIPENIVDVGYYLEQWNSFIKFMHY